MNFHILPAVNKEKKRDTNVCQKNVTKKKKSREKALS